MKITKQLSAFLTALSLFAALSPVTAGAAETEGTIVLYDGLLDHGKVLLSLRSVAIALEADVQWDQPTRTAAVTKNGIRIALTIGSSDAAISRASAPADDSSTALPLGAPARLINGKTYMPLAFISLSLGADVSWDNRDKSAAILLDGRRIVVHTEPLADKPAPAPMTDKQLQAMLDKIAQTADLAGIKQIQTYFRPYFTEKLLQAIVRDGPSGYSYRFKREATRIGYYNGNTRALLFQTSEQDNNGPYAQSMSFLTRSVELVYTATGWKADSIHYAMAERMP